MQGLTPWDAAVDPALPLIDLRSDAVTRPDDRMWAAMRSDALDWSRFGDRTVDRLERHAAELLGVEAALLTPSGTMANTLSLLVAAEPGGSFLVDASAHVLRSEGDAYRLLAAVHPVWFAAEQGRPAPGALEVALQQSDLAGYRHPAVVWLENTHTWSGGSVLPPDEVDAIGAWATDRGIHVHMDGARLWNAAVATRSSVARSVRGVDSVAVNLAKGLGGPAGALLGGSAVFIAEARQRMVALGGGLAQAGILAACGLVALEDPLHLLEDDHRRAERLATGLTRSGASLPPPATNIVLVEVDDAHLRCRELAAQGVLTLCRDATTLRLVTHRDLDDAAIDAVVERWATVFSQQKDC
jgi:threonine aldolase